LLKDPLNSLTLAGSALIFSPFSLTAFPSSSIWNLRFSNKNIYPLFEPNTASSTYFPTQSFKNVTFYPNNFSKGSTTGFIECVSTLFPSGLPKWLAKTMLLGFYSKTFLILGKAAYTLVKFLTFPSLTGTLKSTLIKTLEFYIFLSILSIPIFLDNIDFRIFFFLIYFSYKLFLALILTSK
jgi:hypothetical protein